MRILSKKYVVGAAVVAMLLTTKLYAQGSGSVSQDPRFQDLLADKKRVSSSVTVNDRYKVQIFYGDNEKARKALQDFKREFKNVDGTIVFESPQYKVWVGSYKSRIEAERNLVDIRKKYPYALVVRPNK